MLRYLVLAVLIVAIALGWWENARVSNGQEAKAPQLSAEKNAAGETFQKNILPFLNKNCLACHSEEKRKGDLSLEKYKDDESLQKDRKVWDKVVSMLRSNEMPPKEKP